MPIKNDFTAAYLVFVADLGFFFKTARDYKRDALIIKGGDYGGCSPTFHLLSSLAFELFPKVLLGYRVCLKYKDNTKITEEEIRSEINQEFKKYNHKIDMVYNALPELVRQLDIKNITSFQNGYVWEYRIELNKGSDYIAIKDIEAIRYGSFAKNRDIATICVNDHILIDLLNKIEQCVEEEGKKTRSVLVEQFS